MVSVSAPPQSTRLLTIPHPSNARILLLSDSGLLLVIAFFVLGRRVEYVRTRLARNIGNVVDDHSNRITEPKKKECVDLRYWLTIDHPEFIRRYRALEIPKQGTIDRTLLVVIYLWLQRGQLRREYDPAAQRLIFVVIRLHFLKIQA